MFLHLRLLSSHRGPRNLRPRSQLTRQSTSIGLVWRYRRRLNDWRGWSDHWFFWISANKHWVIIKPSWAHSASHQIPASYNHIISHHRALIDARIASLSSILNNLAYFISLIVRYFFRSIKLIHQQILSLFVFLLRNTLLDLRIELIILIAIIIEVFLIWLGVIIRLVLQLH